ncbi:MAG: glycosyltransferase [Planctomycetota bacterium]|jgi:glycosyltransferase involved in cell wall biosynthesis
MKVVFDGEILAHPPLGGVGISFLHGLRAYAELPETRPVLLLPESASDPQIEGLEVLRKPLGFWRRHFLRPGILRRVSAQVHHSPVAAIPWRAPCPQVATLHDLPWMVSDLPKEEGMRASHRLAARLAAQRAAAILLPSEFSRRQLQDYIRTGCPADCLVVPHGVPEAKLAPDPEDPRGPFLCFGDHRPRKNLVRIAAAHRRAREFCPELPELRVLGPGIEYLTDDQKQQALREARAVFVLSLTEGFGLPVIEAFQYAAPVLCSDRGSLPETAGKAALRVDPCDVEAMARAMIQIHQDEDLRSRLRREGPARAADFTPEKTAAAWLEIHQELCR